MITFIKSDLTTFLKNRKLFNVVENRGKKFKDPDSFLTL